MTRLVPETDIVPIEPAIGIADQRDSPPSVAVIAQGDVGAKHVALQVGRHGIDEFVVGDEQPVLAQAEHAKYGFDSAGGAVPGCERRFVLPESLNLLTELSVKKTLGIRSLDADETQFA
jgi:hypothetical protein